MQGDLHEHPNFRTLRTGRRSRCTAPFWTNASSSEPARTGTERRQRSSRQRLTAVRFVLVTISGKGGWSKDAGLAERWSKNDTVSLLDHLLSVARGALMSGWPTPPVPGPSETELAEIKHLAYALVCIAFLHDIDKDLGLRRGENIAVSAVAERMERYGINEFLKKHRHYVSPAAMLNYIERRRHAGSPQPPPHRTTTAELQQHAVTSSC